MLPPIANKHSLVNIIYAINQSYGGDCYKKINNYFNYKKLYYYKSGTQSLFEIIKSLKQITNRNRVIVQSYTCFSVAKVLEESNLDIVILDTNPVTLDYNYEELESIVDEKTLCVIATHLFGASANLKRIKKITEKYGAYIIEDAAQKQPDLLKETSIADATIYSFGRGKPISLMGGSILGINNTEINKALQTVEKKSILVGNYGLNTIFKMVIADIFTNPLLYALPAWLPFLRVGETIYPEKIENGKMDKIQICFLEKRLFELNYILQKRYAIAQEYTNTLKKYSKQILLEHTKKEEYSPSRYPFYMKEERSMLSRNKRLHLQQYGIVFMYPMGINNLPQLKNKIIKNTSKYEGSDYIANHLVTAPTHCYICSRNLHKVLEILRNIV